MWLIDEKRERSNLRLHRRRENTKAFLLIGLLRILTSGLTDHDKSHWLNLLIFHGLEDTRILFLFVRTGVIYLNYVGGDVIQKKSRQASACVNISLVTLAQSFPLKKRGKFLDGEDNLWWLIFLHGPVFDPEFEPAWLVPGLLRCETGVAFASSDLESYKPNLVWQRS